MSALPKDLLDLIETLQASLEKEWFGFVSDEINDILEQPIGPRGRLFALRDVVRKLGVATQILTNSTRDEIDRVEAAIETHLRTVFEA